MRPNKQQVRSIAEVAQTFRWYVAFAKAPRAVTVPKNFNLQMTTTEIPRREAMQGIEINIRAHKIRRPGTSDVTHTLQMAFVETVDNQISEFLRTWKEALWSTDAGVQQPLDQCTADLVITRLDNMDKPIWQYTLFGCYPEDSDPAGSELNGESEALRPTVTMYYDDFEEKPL